MGMPTHKVAGVKEAIEATGATLLYLSPYSPDFNPIGHCWPDVKQPLRQLKARSLDALDITIPQSTFPDLSGDCQEPLQTLRLFLMLSQGLL